MPIRIDWRRNYRVNRAEVYSSIIINESYKPTFDFLKENPIGEILATPGLILSEFDGVIPDLICISHERRDEILNEADGKFYGAPEIIIEILSPGRVNARRDLQIKRGLYEIYGVPEYWAVKPQEKEIEVFRDGEESVIYTEILETPFLPKLKLSIKNMFAD